jgi:hypothetical protein
MSHREPWVALLAALALCASGATQAAGLFRAYLASDGLDSNPCTLTAPCRLLPAALAAVADGGEIWMLDSANFNTGSVSITKSVTILAVPGAVGSIVSVSGPAIVANTAGTKIVLRNLVLVPLSGGGGTHGIWVNGADRVTLENSVVAGHPVDGIVVLSESELRITDTIIRDNGSHGVEIQNGASAEIARSQVVGNHNDAVVVFGSAAAKTTSASVTNSVLSSNGGNAIDVNVSLAGATARAAISGSTVSGNSTGVRAVSSAGTAIATIGSNAITGNTLGLSQEGAGATIESLGDNLVRQNTTPSSGTITSVGHL